MCQILQQYQLYYLTESINACYHHPMSFILQQLGYKVNVNLLPQLVRYG